MAGNRMKIRKKSLFDLILFNIFSPGTIAGIQGDSGAAKVLNQAATAALI